MNLPNSGVTFLVGNIYRTGLPIHARNRCFDSCCLWEKWTYTMWYGCSDEVLGCSSLNEWGHPDLVAGVYLVHSRFVWWPWVACTSLFLLGTVNGVRATWSLLLLSLVLCLPQVCSLLTQEHLSKPTGRDHSFTQFYFSSNHIYWATNNLWVFFWGLLGRFL